MRVTCPTCPSSADIVRAAMADQPEPLCPTHDAAAIKARAAAEKALEAEERERRLGEITDRIRDRWGDEAASQAAQERADAIDHVRQTDPLLASLFEVRGSTAHVPTPDLHLPLNAKPEDYPALQGFSVDTNPGPFDAA